MSESLPDIIKKWRNAKELSKKYENEEEYYKKIIEKYMNKKDINQLDGEDFVVKRTLQTRSFIDRENIPVDVWNKYSKTCSFYVYRLK